MKLSNKPVLVFDADSVLIDWCFGFFSFLNSIGYCTNHVDHLLGKTEFIPTNEITKIDCKITNKELSKKFADTDWLTRLPLFQEDGHIHLNKLTEKYDIVVLTCIGETEDIISKRKQNLIDLFGDIFLDIICINYGKSKEPYLKELAAKYNVVGFTDDKEAHIEESIQAGVKPLLFSRGVDKCPIQEEKYTVISCLSEVEKHVA